MRQSVGKPPQGFPVFKRSSGRQQLIVIQPYFLDGSVMQRPLAVDLQLQQIADVAALLPVKCTVITRKHKAFNRRDAGIVPSACLPCGQAFGLLHSMLFACHSSPLFFAIQNPQGAAAVEHRRCPCVYDLKTVRSIIRRVFFSWNTLCPQCRKRMQAAVQTKALTYCCRRSWSRFRRWRGSPPPSFCRGTSCTPRA